MAEIEPEGTSERQESPAAHNRDIEQGLKQYCHFPHSQGFAVMLSGQWGSGKTHFIKQLMPELVPPGRILRDHKPLYVSLYGVTDPSEISDQLFQQMHPLLASKPSRFIGAVMLGAAKAAVRVDLGHAVQMSGTLPNLKLGNIMKGAIGRIIIFDDFERALLEPASILGFINPMVEHEDCKVVIVADENQIREKDDYLARKEKTVGQTFELLADSRAAFNVFQNDIDDQDARQFFQRSRETILAVFADSKLNNLRHLRHFLWDFERLWKTLTGEQKKHKEAMQELLSLLCASTIELRSGNMPGALFRRADITHFMRLRDKESNADAIAAEAIFKKYPTVKFDSILLEPDTIKDLVLKSNLPAVRIQRELMAHPFFAKAEDLPSWRALLLSSDFPREDHDRILDDFDADFAARRFQGEAEIYHVIGLSIMLSECGLPNWPAAGLLGKVRGYISDVYTRSEPTSDQMREPHDPADTGSLGLAYASLDDCRFSELAAFHKEQREEWRKKAYPRVAIQLQKLMTSDSEAFLRDVCFTNGGTSRYARLGVLKLISEAEFAETLLAAPVQHAKTVMMALSIRYQQVASEPELEGEILWLKDVHRLLVEGANKLGPLARRHFLQQETEYVAKTVGAAERRLHDKAGLPKPTRTV